MSASAGPRPGAYREHGSARPLHGVQDRTKLRFGFGEGGVFGSEDRFLVSGLLPRKPEGVEGELLSSVWVTYPRPSSTSTASGILLLSEFSNPSSTNSPRSPYSGRS
jgi:hypothetical protein